MILTLRRLLIWTLFFVVAAGIPAAAFSLEKIEQDVREDYSSVRHVPPDALKVEAGPTLIFDVREPDEFEVSHLPGALRVTPGMTPRAFLKRYGAKAAGKRVIFYCSVGVRSSRLAERVQSALKSRGAQSVANLSGGIFRWHNEERKLTNSSGATDWVHPYNQRWGRLVNRKDKLRSTPKAQ